MSSMTTFENHNAPDTASELDAYLGALARDNCLRVERVLKTSQIETTELVSYVGENGAQLGPFIRKRIVRGRGIGGAYEDLFAAQTRGFRARHLPHLYDVHAVGEERVVLMEYVQGSTYAALVADAAEPAARLGLVRRIFPGVCDAATELHDGLPAPVIHRDIKPENIIVAGGTTPVLIDLGIARSYKSEAATDTVHFGTAAYAPPEQYGFGQTDVRSDVYALGLVLWFGLVGHAPTTSDRELLYTDPAVPEPLRRVIVRAAAFDPAARFASASDLRRAFEDALAEVDRAAAAGEGAPAAMYALGEKGTSPTAPAPERVLSEYAPAAEKITQPMGQPHVAASHTWGAAAPGEQHTAPDVPASRRATGVRAAVAAQVDRLAAWASERVPAWVGRIWNAALLVLYALCLMGCVLAVMDPAPVNLKRPQWFLAVEYVGYLWPLFTAVLLALVDRRRLKRRFARQVRWTSRGALLFGLCWLIGGLFVVALAGEALGF